MDFISFFEVFRPEWKALAGAALVAIEFTGPLLTQKDHVILKISSILLNQNVYFDKGNLLSKTPALEGGGLLSEKGNVTYHQKAASHRS